MPFCTLPLPFRHSNHARFCTLYSLVVHDVTEPLTLEVDQIYHLACPASPPHYQFNPVKTIKTSTMGTLNMLGLAVSTIVKTLHILRLRIVIVIDCSSWITFYVFTFSLTICVNRRLYYLSVYYRFNLSQYRNESRQEFC